MSRYLLQVAVVLTLGMLLPPVTQAASQTASVQQQMLKSADPQVAANKRLVFDFWRTILDGGHLELASRYLSKDYIQHNPNVPTGRDGFVAFFAKFSKPHLVSDHIDASLISIVGEGDLVIVSFKRRLPDPQIKNQYYVTTWFDMFRVEHGKIVEHWDEAQKS
jgi:predicted SnoaL-like aldol condensation-catalyzing enzyme